MFTTMESLGVHLTILLCLLLGNILFGGIPFIISKVVGFYSSSEVEWYNKLKWTTFFQYVGAGIFISNSFIVLLPQANRLFEPHHNHTHADSSISSLQKSSGHHHHESFPIPEFTVLSGFFVAFVLQEVAYFILSRFSRSSGEARDLRVRFCSCAKRHTECSRTFKDVRPDQTMFGMEKKLAETESGPGSRGAASNVLPEVEVSPKSELLRSSILSQAVPNYGAVTNATEPSAMDAQLPVLTPPVVLAAGEGRRLLVEQQCAATSDRDKFLISSALLVLELSLQYSILGIHLGLMMECSLNWPNLTLAGLQNFLLTFSAGSYLAASCHMKLSHVGLVIGLLSCVSPTGMAIAVFASNSMREGIPPLAEGIIASVACGALIYTTFYHFLRRTSSRSVRGLVKFFAIALGASLMASLQCGILSVL